MVVIEIALIIIFGILNNFLKWKLTLIFLFYQLKCFLILILNIFIIYSNFFKFFINFQCYYKVCFINLLFFPEFTLNFGFFYRGYRRECYFWEIVMFSRKFLLIFIGVFTKIFEESL